MGNFFIVPLLHSLSDMSFAKILIIYSTLLQNLNSEGKETRKHWASVPCNQNSVMADVMQHCKLFG